MTVAAPVAPLKEAVTKKKTLHACACVCVHVVVCSPDWRAEALARKADSETYVWIPPPVKILLLITVVGVTGY